MYGNGYVCDDSFAADEAYFVCRQMGFSQGHLRYATSTVPVDRYTIDNLNCPRTATRLSQCTYSRTDDCSISEGVQLSCRGTMNPATTSRPGNNSNMGHAEH